MTTPPENETATPEELRSKKEHLLREYKALKEKQTFADNDCDRGFIEEERSALAVRIKALARRIEALEAEQA